jgi:CRISPR/Cas system-associated exonuclease Cas4 (RecB family)
MIGPISPTGLARYQRCPLSEWFRIRHARNGEMIRPVGATARLGRAAHETVEALIKDTDFPGTWQRPFETRWTEALTRQAQQAEEAAERLAPPDAWPDLMTIKLGVRGCLGVFESTLDPDDTLRSEWKHTTSDGVIRGAADIIVEGPSGDRIVDLKTGRYGQEPQGLPQQLLLYATTWYDATTRMPRFVELLLARSASHCQLPVEEASVHGAHQTALNAHEVLKCAEQPASTPGEHCRHCPALGSCGDGRDYAQRYDDVLLGLVVNTRRNADGRVSAVSVLETGHAAPTEVSGLQVALDIEGRDVFIVGVRRATDGRLVARPHVNVAVIDS